MMMDTGPLRNNKDYRLLFLGQGISLLGSLLTFVAIPYQVWELSHSSFVVGLLGSAQLLPLAFTAFWGGAYADAMDRRKLLIGSELVLSSCSLGLALNALSGKPSLFLIFTLSAVMAAAGGFHRPTLDAMTPQLVKRSEMTAAAALGSFKNSLCSIAGPALGGFLIANYGVPVTYFLDLLSFLASLGCLAALSRMPPAKGAKSPGLGSIKQGLAYAMSRPLLIGTYVVDIVAMTFAMPIALFPAMAEAWGGASALSWVYTAMPLGVAAMTLTSAWCAKVRRHGAAITLAAAGWGLAVIALGLSKGLVLAILFLALAGAADNVSAIFRITIWNQTIPRGLRRRLASLEVISYMSGPLLGNVRAGWMAGWLGLGPSIAAGGLLCTVGVLACVPLLPALWTYRSSHIIRASN